MANEERQRQLASDDWQEGQQSGSDQSPESNSSFDSREQQRLDEEREAYIRNMSKRFGKTLDQEIRRMETKDMTRRKIKKVENEDKLYDFVKIKDIKQEKLEQ